MMNSLWIAKTGMNAQQTNMDTVSHNLANVTTTGFKRQTAVFEDLIYQNLRQVGLARWMSKTSCPPACTWAWACARWPPRAPSRKARRWRPARPTTWPSMAMGFSKFKCPMAAPPTPATAPLPSMAMAPWSPRAATRCWTALPCCRFAQLHHQQNRHRHRAGPGRDRAAANRPAEPGHLYQSGWIGAGGRKPLPRNPGLGRTANRAPGDTSIGTVLQCYLEVVQRERGAMSWSP